MTLSSAQNPLAGLGGYDLRYLVTHLAEAGRAHELRKLLSLDWGSSESGTYRNAWFEAKDSAGSFQEYANDLATAWRAAEHDARASLEQGEPAPAIGLQARYAMMTSCLTSLAADLPANFLVTLVRHGRWTAEQAIAYARRQIDQGLRASALAALVEYAPQADWATVISEVFAALPQVSLQWVSGGLETNDYRGRVPLSSSYSPRDLMAHNSSERSPVRARLTRPTNAVGPLWRLPRASKPTPRGLSLMRRSAVSTSRR